MIAGEDHREALIKFFTRFTNLRGAAQSGVIGAAITIEINKSKTNVPTIPILINLGALTKEEGIQYMLRYNKVRRDVLSDILDEEIEKTQWIKDGK